MGLLILVFSPKFENVPISDQSSVYFSQSVPVSPEEERAIHAKKRQAVKLKKDLRNHCEIFTKGPICLGKGARIISKALNMEGVIADYTFDEDIVKGFFDFVRKLINLVYRIMCLEKLKQSLGKMELALQHISPTLLRSTE
jgi:hypothetical protein